MAFAAAVLSVFGVQRMTDTSTTVATPLQQPTDADTDFQALRFFVKQRLLKIQTSTLVEVQAVHGGGVGPIGTVDVLPLVNQVDGAGNSIPHKTIYGRPYSRLMGGASAVIMDPAVGDKGLMVFASRDLTAVIVSQEQSPPPSLRTYSYADGLYVFSCLSDGDPTQYIEFVPNDGGINVKTSGAFNVDAASMTVTTSGATNINGAQISSAGEVTDADGKVLGTHTHLPGTYVAPSGGGAVTGDSGAPV